MSSKYFILQWYLCSCANQKDLYPWRTVVSQQKAAVAEQPGLADHSINWAGVQPTQCCATTRRRRGWGGSQVRHCHLFASLPSSPLHPENNFWHEQIESWVDGQERLALSHPLYCPMKTPRSERATSFCPNVCYFSCSMTGWCQRAAGRVAGLSQNSHRAADQGSHIIQCQET